MTAGENCKPIGYQRPDPDGIGNLGSDSENDEDEELEDKSPMPTPPPSPGHLRRMKVLEGKTGKWKKN